jgi:hypothetical protein
MAADAECRENKEYSEPLFLVYSLEDKNCLLRSTIEMKSSVSRGHKMKRWRRSNPKKLSSNRSQAALLLRILTSQLTN